MKQIKHKLHVVAGTLTAMILAFGGHAMQAQNKMAPIEMPFNEVSVSVYGPSVASVPFADGTAKWNDKLGYALGIGADYTYWFGRHVGIAAGLKVSYMNTRQRSEAFATDFTGTLPISTLGRTGVSLHGTAASISEMQTITFVEVPVRLALTFKKIYLNLGISAATEITNFSTFGYDAPAYNITDLTEMGIHSLNVPVKLTDNKNGVTFQNTDAGWPFFVLLSFEGGYKFCFDKRNALSLGLYGRYALTQSEAKGDKQPFTLANDRVSTALPSATDMVKSLGYYEFGLRITYHYGVGQKRTVMPH